MAYVLFLLNHLRQGAGTKPAGFACLIRIGCISRRCDSSWNYLAILSHK